MTTSTAHPTRVAVVGVGNVGATFAYALLLSGLASEIVLIDANRQRAEGEATDLTHAVPFSRPTRVWAGDYADCAGAAVTVITAGAAQRPGEDRLSLVKRNDGIFGQIVPAVAAANPDGIIVVATNPVDVLAYRTWQRSGLPPDRVIGSGTIRHRSVPGPARRALRRRPASVHAYIAGEHGDTEVPIWSSASIGGMLLRDYCLANDIPYDEAALRPDLRRHARRGVPDHRAEGRDVLRGRGRPDAAHRGDPARPEHRAPGVDAGPRLSRASTTST